MSWRLFSTILSLALCSIAMGQGPVPTINSLAPTVVPTGGPDFTLWTGGAGLTASSVIHVDGIALATTMPGYGGLEAVVPATFIATSGSITVSVVNPPPGGGSSNTLSLPVQPISLGGQLMIHGPAIGAFSQPSMDSAGDVDLDGRDDILISNGTQTWIFSGSTGWPLLSLPVGGQTRRLGDVNGDGVPEFLIIGQDVLVVSGGNGVILRSHVGWSASDGGEDLDGDSVPDYVIGKLGQVDALSGLTGAVIRTWVLANTITPRVWLLGDTTGDGLSEVGVSVPFPPPVQPGSNLIVYSVTTGNLITSFGGGWKVFRMGDLDGDGLAEICHSDATDLWFRYSSGIASAFINGASAAFLGDIDGDGTGDYAVGTTAESVHLFSGIITPTGPTPLGLISCPGSNGFGLHVAGRVDINGDGHGDLIVAASQSTPYGPAGSGFIWGAAFPTATIEPGFAPCHPFPSPSAQATLAVTPLVVGAPVNIDVLSQLTTVPGVLAVATQPAPIPIPISSGCLLNFDLAQSLLIPFMSDSSGSWTLPFVFPNAPALVGITFEFQAALFQVPNATGFTLTHGIRARVGY